MDLKLHANATTTPRTRAYIQKSRASNAALARELGIHSRTVARWKARREIVDRSTRPHRLATTMTEWEEGLIVELRRSLALPLDDIVEAMRRCINPALSRSAIHRCLQRYGISARRSQQQAPTAMFHTDAPAGFIHIDVKYLPPLNRRRSYAYVAIDRATRFVYLEILPDRRAQTAAGFLNRFLDRFPLSVHTVLTDNGSEFTDRFAVDKKDKPHDKPSGHHPFYRVCTGRVIIHRLARPFRPQTNGMVERFNRRLGDHLDRMPQNRAAHRRRFLDHAERDAYLTTFVADYNRTRLRCLGYQAPAELLANLSGHNTIAGAMHFLFPGSLTMLRLVPALAHAATVVLVAAVARRLGGGLWAQAVAALCVLTGGVFLGIRTTLSTGALEPLAGLFCAYALIRIIRDREERWWLALGVAAGIALQAKYLIAFWLAGLGLGLIAPPSRRSLLSPYLYGGFALAALVALPNVLWQASNGWPFVELGRVAVERKNVAVPPLDFLWQTVEQFNDAAALVWLAGLVGFAFWERFADLRLFAIAFVAFFAAVIVLHGKTYYLANALPVLIAGGAVALEAWLASRILRFGLVAAIVAIGLVGAPFALPILPVAQFAAYQRALGIAPHREEEQGKIGVLSQYYADMFGWPELAGRVAEIYRSLTPDERKQAVFLGNNYGEAAAIDVFGRPLGLPPAISGHNNYYLWGPRGHDGSVVIRLGGKPEVLLKAYASCTAAGTTDSPWAMPMETGRTLWVCRGRHPPMDKAWASFKHYG